MNTITFRSLDFFKLVGLLAFLLALNIRLLAKLA